MSMYASSTIILRRKGKSRAVRLLVREKIMGGLNGVACTSQKWFLYHQKTNNEKSRLFHSRPCQWKPNKISTPACPYFLNQSCHPRSLSFWPSTFQRLIRSDIYACHFLLYTPYILVKRYFLQYPSLALISSSPSSLSLCVLLLLHVLSGYFEMFWFSLIMCFGEPG